MAQRLLEQLRLGVPMGVLPAADLIGFAMFQMMQIRLGIVDGAATQMVMMLTSLSYMPGFGIPRRARRSWANRSAPTRATGLSGWATAPSRSRPVYMCGIGVIIALTGPWLLPFFTGARDADRSQRSSSA